jgi:site-specific DNA recombinase
MRQAVKQGRWLWQAPIGYVNDRTNKVILPHETYSPLVQFAFENLAKEVYSIEEVRRMASNKGLKLCKQAFINLLQNPLYMGKIFLKGYKDEPDQLINGIHEPLISEELFNDVQRILKGKKKPYKGYSKKEQLPLAGYLICPKCGRLLTASSSKGRSKHYAYYHCQRKYGCSLNIPAQDLNNKFIRLLEKLQPSEESVKLYELILEDVFKAKGEDRETEKLKLELEINELDMKIDSIETKYINDVLSFDVYEKHKRRFESEKNDLVMRHITLSQLPTQFSAYLNFGVTLIRNVSKYYLEAPIDTKKKIIGSIFPEKLQIAGDSYRTTKMNEVFAWICNTDGLFQKQMPGKKTGQSTVAPQTGLEPVTL